MLYLNLHISGSVIYTGTILMLHNSDISLSVFSYDVDLEISVVFLGLDIFYMSALINGSHKKSFVFPYVLDGNLASIRKIRCTRLFLKINIKLKYRVWEGPYTSSVRSVGKSGNEISEMCYVTHSNSAGRIIYAVPYQVFVRRITPEYRKVMIVMTAC